MGEEAKVCGQGLGTWPNLGQVWPHGHGASWPVRDYRCQYILQDEPWDEYVNPRTRLRVHNQIGLLADWNNWKIILRIKRHSDLSSTQPSSWWSKSRCSWLQSWCYFCVSVRDVVVLCRLGSGYWRGRMYLFSLALDEYSHITYASKINVLNIAFVPCSKRRGGDWLHHFWWGWWWMLALCWRQVHILPIWLLIEINRNPWKLWLQMWMQLWWWHEKLHNIRCLRPCCWASPAKTWRVQREVGGIQTKDWRVEEWDWKVQRGTWKVQRGTWKVQGRVNWPQDDVSQSLLQTVENKMINVQLCLYRE